MRIKKIKIDKFVQYLILMIILQGYFSYKIQELYPNIGIIPPLPKYDSVKLISLGDEELFFRYFTLRIQNAGDTFNRFTSLKEYNYNLLIEWFKLLDMLNLKANSIPGLAVHYYSLTPNKDDVRKIVEYLRERAQKDYHTNWWWLSRAVFISQHKLNDLDLTLEIAQELANNADDTMPYWVKQLPAFVYEIRGEKEQAYFIIKNLLDNEEKLSDAEKEFMNVYVERIMEDF